MFFKRDVNGDPPISIQDVKDHLYLRHAKHDSTLERYLKAAVTAGEKYTGRDFSACTWIATADYFFELGEIQRCPMNAITSLTYVVSDSPVTIATSVYQLCKNHQYSGLALKADQEWPTDGDDALNAIVCTFTTDPTEQEYIDEAILGLLKHIAFLYENRGDSQGTDKDMRASGAALHYDQFRIERV